MIYFDNAATTPVLPEISKVIEKALLEDWGNPSSLHRKGFEAEKIVREAEEVIAGVLGVDPKTLIFTSGATEANNTFLKGAVKGKKGNIIVSSVEHSSVLKTAMGLGGKELEVRQIPSDGHARISVSDAVDLVDENTLLVSCMQVNNELGTLEPIEEMAQAVKKKNPRTLFHTDGTQGFCKIPLDLKKSRIDAYSMSAHKIHGPKGIGFLYLRPGLSLPPLIEGGGQQEGKRSGTENVPYLAGFAAACQYMEKFLKDHPEKIQKLHDAAVKEAMAMDRVHILSPLEGVSPYILSLGIEGIKAEVLLHFLEKKEMYLSTGSACSLGKPSSVIEACKVPPAYRDGVVRISFQTENTVEEIPPFFQEMKEAVQSIRRARGK